MIATLRSSRVSRARQFNGMRCPPTGVAAQFTEERRDNFDIDLPEWLARRNKTVFGLLYVVGIAVTFAQWLHR